MNVRSSVVVGILGVVVLTMMFMGAFLALELNGRPTDGFVTTFAPMLAPTIAALMVLFKQEKVEQEVREVKTEVQDVKDKTNGHMTTLVDAVVHSGPVQPSEERA